MYKKLKKILISEPRQRHKELMSVLKDIKWELKEARRNQDAIRLATSLPVINEVESFYTTNQLSMEDTLGKIHKNNLSFARFGDGEFQIMLQVDYYLKFQRNTPELQASLKSILASEASNEYIIGLPNLFKDRNQTPAWLTTWPRLSHLLRKDTIYGNSHVTRPIFFQTYGQKGVEMWRKIWNQKKIVVITGKNSRFELIDELFDNIKSSEFIYTKPTDAYEEIDDIMKRTKKVKGDIFLVALGPAGTVLAHLLATKGRRAIDIGHISDSYLNVFNGGAWPEDKKVSTK